MTRPRHRRASRVVLLDEHDHFLLFLTSIPHLKIPTVRWLTPGGGLDEHETHHQGALRELQEETGLHVLDLGSPIWSIEGKSIHKSGFIQTSYTEFFAYRTNRFPVSKAFWMPNEHEDIADIKWWSASELMESGEPYSPEPLLEIYERAKSMV